MFRIKMIAARINHLINSLLYKMKGKNMKLKMSQLLQRLNILNENGSFLFSAFLLSNVKFFKIIV